MKQNKILIPITAGILLATLFLQNKILRKAKKWLGVREIGNNVGFDNKIFEKKLKEVGFKPGYQYCTFFVKMVLKDAGYKKLLSYINGSSRTSFEKLKNAPGTKFITEWKQAKPGDIAFYKWTNLQLKNGGEGVALRFRKASSLHSGNFQLLGFIRVL